MTFDPHRNFAYSTVATAPSPATSGTSLVVQPGDGALFPQPSTDGAFNLTIWPAGAAPVASNAEIVRCTARSSDTLTITRAQESTSARAVITGDQIALTITAKIFTDIETQSSDPTEIQVGAPTGVAATDNAAIAAAITACPTGGVVQLQAGTYAITGLTIAKTMTLRGRGGADALWANFGTLLTLDSATAVAVEISAHGVKVERLAIQNTHVTAPTAGAGVRTVTGGGNSQHYGPDLSVRGFYYNVDHQAGAEWYMAADCFMYDFVYCGLRIQNVDLVDAGDSWISGEFVAGPVNNATACIQWLTGGGAKIVGAKLNTRNSKTCTIGIDMELQDGVNTVDFLVIGCSIENTDWGFLCEHGGSTHSGTFHHIVISGCQFATIGGSNTDVIAVAANSTSKIADINISGNIIRGGGSQNGIALFKIDNVSHGPNVFHSGLAANYFDGGSNTNITSVGNG